MGVTSTGVGKTEDGSGTCVPIRLQPGEPFLSYISIASHGFVIHLRGRDLVSYAAPSLLSRRAEHGIRYSNPPQRFVAANARNREHARSIRLQTDSSPSSPTGWGSGPLRLRQRWRHTTTAHAPPRTCSAQHLTASPFSPSIASMACRRFSVSVAVVILHRVRHMARSPRDYSHRKNVFNRLPYLSGERCNNAIATDVIAVTPVRSVGSGTGSK